MNNIAARQDNTVIQAANDTAVTDTTLRSAPPGHLNTRAVHHYPTPAAASQSGSTQATHTIAQELLAAIPAERLGSSMKQTIEEVDDNDAAPATASASATGAPASVTLSHAILDAATLKGDGLGAKRNRSGEIISCEHTWTVYKRIQDMVNCPAFQLNPRDFINQEKRKLLDGMKATEVALQFIDEFLNKRERAAIERAFQEVTAAQQCWTTKNLTSREKATVAGLISADTGGVQALAPQLIEAILDYSNPISSNEILNTARADANFHVLERHGMSISEKRDELLARVTAIVTAPEFQEDPVQYMTAWNEEAARKEQAARNERPPERIHFYSSDIPRIKLTQILVNKGVMKPLPEVNPFINGPRVISGMCITFDDDAMLNHAPRVINAATMISWSSTSININTGERFGVSSAVINHDEIANIVLMMQ